METFSDCFWGLFHQCGRLELAGFGLFFHQTLSVVAFLVVLLWRRDLVLACLAMLAAALFCLFSYTLPLAAQMERIQLSFVWSENNRLLRICLPLFASVFLQNFVISLPKYALDAYYPSALQAYFTAIFLPAQVINTLGMFLFMLR